MFPQTVFFLLLATCFCSNLETRETRDDCVEEILLSDENGTTFYHSQVVETVKFFLLTEDNGSIALNSSNLHLVNTSQPTKLLVHGLGSFEDHAWVDTMAAVYHTKGEYNIIAVDWSSVSVQNRDYVVSAVDAVGTIVGTFIMEITQTNYEYLSDVHLIGSSMGAQIGGAAGETVNATGHKLGRITGLDPTVPQHLEVLDEDDAEFVDVIHTTLVLGEGKTGRVDFYIVDGGEPVCYNGTNTTDSCGELLGSDFYIQTIEDEYRFQGISCYNGSSEVRRLCDKAVMGEYAPRNISGSYLVAKGAASRLGSFTVVWLVSLVMLWYL